MNNKFNIKYNVEKNILIISKPHIGKSIRMKTGKYGIQGCYNIEDSLFSICIPDPDLLFGLKQNDLKKFVRDNLN